MRLILLVLISLGAALPAVAAEDAPDCAEPMDQMTMNLCAALDFEKADKTLNGIWPGLKEEARQQDAEEGQGKTDYLDALVASQRAWIAFRDAECRRRGYDAKGGSMEPMLVSGCLASLTEERIKSLQSTEEGQ